MNSEDYGLFSPKWLMKEIARQVDREHLEAGFRILVTWVDGVARGYDVIPVTEVMDMATQVMLTGEYVETTYVTREPVEDYPYSAEADEPPDETAGPITEEEIQRSIRRWDEILGDAVDPFGKEES